MTTKVGVSDHSSRGKPISPVHIGQYLGARPTLVVWWPHIHWTDVQRIVCLIPSKYSASVAPGSMRLRYPLSIPRRQSFHCRQV